MVNVLYIVCRSEGIGWPARLILGFGLELMLHDGRIWRL